MLRARAASAFLADQPNSDGQINADECYISGCLRCAAASAVSAASSQSRCFARRPHAHIFELCACDGCLNFVQRTDLSA